MQSVRSVLITGGSGALATAIAEALPDTVERVAVAYHTNEAKAARAVASLTNARKLAIAFGADLRRANEASHLVQRAEETLGPLDAVVHAAGNFHRRAILDETPASWREAFATHVDSLLFIAQAVTPGMRSRRFGRIVCFGLAGVDDLPAFLEIPAHGIAKAGVVMLSRTLARALGPFGITVNTVSPGRIVDGTEKADDVTPKGARDVASAVRFFLSEAAERITGADLVVGRLER